MRGYLLQGETMLLRKEHTQLWISTNQSLKGSLLVTPYRLLFLSYTQQKAPGVEPEALNTQHS